MAVEEKKHGPLLKAVCKKCKIIPAKCSSEYLVYADATEYVTAIKKKALSKDFIKMCFKYTNCIVCELAANLNFSKNQCSLVLCRCLEMAVVSW